MTIPGMKITKITAEERRGNTAVGCLISVNKQQARGFGISVGMLVGVGGIIDLRNISSQWLEIDSRLIA
jgi:hypothetical protein